MKKIFLVLMIVSCATVLVSATARSQTAIAQWSFEGVTTNNIGTTINFSVGSAAADAGSQTSGSFCTVVHAGSSTSWSNPSGNGSQKSISSTFWGVGDYYQFLFSTINYSGISFIWSQMGSNTGPRDFKVQYSTDGSSFNDVSGTNSTYMVTNDAWVSTSVKTASIRTIDLSSVSALNNQLTVYVRLVDNSTTSVSAGTVATGGSDRVDSVTVIANIALPVELTSFTALAGKNSIELAWNTATEVNNYGFDIERRSISNESRIEHGTLGSAQSTMNSWAKIGFVSGNGTSNMPHGYSFIDNSATFGTYSYRLKQIDRNGNFEYSKEVEAAVAMAPNTIVLGQNYPNPFNPRTSIEFAVPKTGFTMLKVYNMLG
jgi:hypothetical protein